MEAQRQMKRIPADASAEIVSKPARLKGNICREWNIHPINPTSFRLQPLQALHQARLIFQSIC